MLFLLGLFALVGPDNEVKNVVVADQAFVDTNPAKNSPVGKSSCGDGCRWIEYTMDGSKGKNPASINGTYNDELKAFVPRKTFKAWVLDPVTARWKPPVEAPKDGKKYQWDDATDSWKERADKP